MIENIYPKIPIFLMGLSMGGLTCYKMGLENPDRFKGIILMAPALKGLKESKLIDIIGGLSCLLFG
jgi:alpha-beta hydrolase superfamily lysophospholipase